MFKQIAIFILYRILFPVYNKFIFGRFVVAPDIMDTEETIEYICSSKCSVSRFGDGELEQTWRNTNLGFQKWSKGLQRRLREVIMSQPRDFNHLVCIPFPYLNTDYMTAAAASYWKRISLRHRVFVMPWLPSKKYGDSLCTRLYMDYENKAMSKKYFAMWRQVWNSRDIVLVEGVYSRLGVGNDMFDNARSIKRIIIPEANAYEVYPAILSAVSKHCKKTDCILIAAGPTASVLAYDLAKAGYWAIDIGHIDVEYMWCKMGAVNKVPIPGRFLNETKTQSQLSLNDRSYEDSIVCRIAHVAAPVE